MIKARMMTQATFSAARILSVSLLVTLQACSGGSGGGSTERDPSTTVDTGASGGFSYAGPAAANTETQSFKREFYDNLTIAGRCGDCHTSGGSGPTPFVDKADVNTAWQQAKSVVNLSDPAASVVVQRVANGHNCWLGSGQTASCRTAMIAYISNWAASSSGEATSVKLLPRTPVDPSGTKSFPVTPPTEYTNAGGLHSLLVTHCSDCHSPGAAIAQSPYFASNDVVEAYEAVKSKIDLITVESSRLVVRLRQESHHCWSGSCDNDADELARAIKNIADTLFFEDIDAALIDSISKAQVLGSDGILASSGGRYEDDIVAEWKFGEGRNPADISQCMNNSQCTLTSSDTSGVQPEITLTLEGEFDLFSSGGIRFINGSARALSGTSVKLRNTLAAAGEYSIEAWIIPDNVSQEDTSIISYSGISNNRNFALGQTLYNYDFYNRSSGSDSSGGPVLSTPDADELAQATLQHVVLTFDPVNGRRLYVNGILSDVVDDLGGGTMPNWNDTFSVVIGNDASGSRPWKGIVRLLALHSRALTPAQIQQNTDIGIGLDYYLLFSVSHLIDEEGVCHQGSGSSLVNYCYIVFKVSQFDEYSYQFSDPFFVNLNEDNVALPDIHIKGIYLGINGKLAAAGQAFSSIDQHISSANYTAGGVPLANIGTIISLEEGAADDEFFLSFEDFNGAEGVELSPINAADISFNYSLVGTPTSKVGVRTFEEINATLAKITGIASTRSQVHQLFYGAANNTNDQGIKQQLPTIADFQAYQASHQTGVAQLAIAYCDALVEDAGARSGFFNNGGTTFDFSQRADLVSDANWRNLVIAPLLKASLILETGDPLFLASQPLRESGANENVTDILLDLITDTHDAKPYPFNSDVGDYVSAPDGVPDGLARCDGAGNSFDCPAGRTEEVVKAVCASVLGSAAVLLQ